MEIKRNQRYHAFWNWLKMFLGIRFQRVYLAVLYSLLMERNEFVLFDSKCITRQFSALMLPSGCLKVKLIILLCETYFIQNQINEVG
ncbi:unnamed protein product [Blepharisma stoltei]|uniref:Uncharacterized protein n=1 Tax=Blepharisma stoltei TaxID=1481888 RepID=A0AAU9I9Z0_9CILI|nr:unnamed protein product [Blepharisma stoltei]